jgi:hypothetical protein
MHLELTGKVALVTDESRAKKNHARSNTLDRARIVVYHFGTITVSLAYRHEYIHHP